MQYMLILNETNEHFDMRNGQADVAQAYWGAWSAYIAEMYQAGIVVSGSGLQAPHTTSVVTVRDGVRHVQDGPFADTKEQLGGYFIIEVPNLDAALDWAAKSPSAQYANCEVRPLLPPMNA